ncbi:MAG: PxxKW family cysteine-rich protein [Thermodesulfobacteriota bacterium]
MHCVSVKPGVDCAFMSKKGCSFNGGKCHTIVESCEGCDRILKWEDGSYCGSFPDPKAKWRTGHCNLATHVKKEKKDNGSGKINPLKASKRKAAGR